MQRCFTLYDVQSQPQYSVNQRRAEMMNERVNNDEDHVNSDTNRSDMAQTQVPEIQENEEVYNVNIDDESRPSTEFTRDPIPIYSSRIQQRGRVNRGRNFKRSAGSSRVTIGSSPRAARRKQSFETTLTNTMTGFREFQRQSFAQLCPGAFDQDDFDEFTTARHIFEAMEVTKFSDFWCKCMHELQEDKFWRKYFIDKAESSNEEKLQFFEALTGCTRHGEKCEKRLGSRQHYGCPNSSGVLSGSPSSPLGTPRDTYSKGNSSPVSSSTHQHPQAWHLPRKIPCPSSASAPSS
ncbi:hypothetical protein V5N11_019302 [Cardamine amara subsp. amara]|uniref:Uncharacterized protein n=1 Tax=Cardamine amara subsp. amara TaxID=228776 RepID=A0ABD1C7V0_CARAN